MKNHKIVISSQKIPPVKKYHKNFKKCIGTGKMSLALRQDYQENLSIVQKEIGFEYIRGHGLFNDEMGVYRESIQVGATPVRKLENPIYSFKNILKVFDSFLALGIRPFVEFGFMPNDMAAGDSTVFWWKGNVTEPKDMALWETLIKKFLETAMAYYGEEEVKQWYFEVWNEPCVDFWQPTKGEREETYYRLYEATARTVKEVHKELRVGGPATQEQGIEWIPRFLDFCYQNNVPLDYVSHHIYTGKDRKFEGEFCYMKHMEPSETVGKYKRVFDMAENGPQGKMPLHITEWNTSFSCIDPMHDGEVNGAYVAYLLTHVDHMLTSYAYWVFCDVFEEADIPRALFHGGFGLLTENGIRKPSFHAFAFANRLKDTVIHLDEYTCVTTDDTGNYAVLLFNPAVNTDKGDALEIEISLPSTYKEMFVSKQTVDRDHGNAYEVWKKLGRSRWPDENQMEIIKRGQYPAVENNRIKTTDGYINIVAKLPVNGFQLIEIIVAEDFTHTYQGSCN